MPRLVSAPPISLRSPSLLALARCSLQPRRGQGEVTLVEGHHAQVAQDERGPAQVADRTEPGHALGVVRGGLGLVTADAGPAARARSATWPSLGVAGARRQRQRLGVHRLRAAGYSPRICAAAPRSPRQLAIRVSSPSPRQMARLSCWQTALRGVSRPAPRRAARPRPARSRAAAVGPGPAAASAASSRGRPRPIWPRTIQNGASAPASASAARGPGGQLTARPARGPDRLPAPTARHLPEQPAEHALARPRAGPRLHSRPTRMLSRSVSSRSSQAPWSGPSRSASPAKSSSQAELAAAQLRALPGR